MQRTAAFLGVLLICSTGWQRPATAQDTTAALPAGAVLRLQLIDDETGEPIPGAVIKMKGRPDTTTGAAGRIEIVGLESKLWRVEFRALGYEPRMESIHLAVGSVTNLRFGLSFTGDQLPDIVVTARRATLSPRYADFYRRMEKGMGYYTTWDVIKQRNHSTIGDVLRGVRGVSVICRIGDCEITMTRSRGCQPAYWVDGIEGRAFASSMPIRDVYGIEVYRGAGETPGEYVGTGGCGVIVIWTKNKPYR